MKNIWKKGKREENTIVKRLNVLPLRKMMMYYKRRTDRTEENVKEKRQALIC